MDCREYTVEILVDTYDKKKKEEEEEETTTTTRPDR